jgi:hypothetical protein
LVSDSVANPLTIKKNAPRAGFTTRPATAAHSIRPISLGYGSFGRYPAPIRPYWPGFMIVMAYVTIIDTKAIMIIKSGGKARTFYDRERI